MAPIRKYPVIGQITGITSFLPADSIFSKEERSLEYNGASNLFSLNVHSDSLPEWEELPTFFQVTEPNIVFVEQVQRRARRSKVAYESTASS